MSDEQPQQLLQLHNHFCQTYKRYITTLGILAEDVSVAKTKEFHQDVRSLIKETTHVKLPKLNLPSNQNGVIENGVKAFIFFNYLYIYVPLNFPTKGWKRTHVMPYFKDKSVTKTSFQLFPFSSKLSNKIKLNLKYFGVWIYLPVISKQMPMKLIIDQTFTYEIPALDGSLQEYNLTELLNLRDLKIVYYKEHQIGFNFSQADYEMFVICVYLKWPKVNLDPKSFGIADLLIELDSNERFQKFAFDGWNLYYLVGLEFAAFIYYPTSDTNKWTCLKGKYEMPKKIYLTANSPQNVRNLMNRLKWFNGKSIEIHNCGFNEDVVYQ